MEIIEKWKVQDSVENYGVQYWGKGYFGINSAGHVTVPASTWKVALVIPAGAGDCGGPTFRRRRRSHSRRRGG